MTGILVLFAGMVLFATTVTVMDRRARRRQRATATPLFDRLAVDRRSR
jgi:hypothetical protein